MAPGVHIERASADGDVLEHNPCADDLADIELAPEIAILMGVRYGTRVEVIRGQKPDRRSVYGGHERLDVVVREDRQRGIDVGFDPAGRIVLDVHDRVDHEPVFIEPRGLRRPVDSLQRDVRLLDLVGEALRNSVEERPADHLAHDDVSVLRVVRLGSRNVV